MTFTQIITMLRTLGLYKTSTGEVDKVTTEQAVEALVNISVLQGELAEREKELRKIIPIEKLPMEATNGKVITKDKTESSVNVYAVYCEVVKKGKVITEEEFWQAVKLSESHFDKKSETGKVVVASIIKNKTSEVVGKSLVVLKNERIKDFSIEIMPETV